MCSCSMCSSSRKMDVASIFGSALFGAYYQAGASSTRGSYAHYYWASDYDEAAAVARLLKMSSPHPHSAGNEISLRFLLSSVPNATRDVARYLRRPRSLRLFTLAMHSVAHLSFLAHRALDTPAAQLLGDLGMMHSLIHHAHFQQGTPVFGFYDPKTHGLALLEDVRRTAVLVPGYMPQHLDLWVRP